MYIADLHIHSRYARATSRDCDAPHLDWWARRKGIALVGTGDFTHPAWRAELREKLIPQKLHIANQLPLGQRLIFEGAHIVFLKALSFRSFVCRKRRDLF